MVTYKWKDSEGWKLKQFTSFNEVYSLAKANPGVHFIYVGKVGNEVEIDYFKNLDNRICDVEIQADNTQTYREFIYDAYTEFGWEKPIMTNSAEVKHIIDFLDDILDK